MRGLLASLAACAALALQAPAQAPAQNVLVIVLDDVAPGFIGAYDVHYQSIGRPSQTPARTPAIDTLLAQRGLMFTRAWAAPLCTPARAQMMTGKYSYRTGAGQVTKPRGVLVNPGLDTAIETLPERIAQSGNGYTRVALGKWHLSDRYQLLANPLLPLGVPAGEWFDRFVGTMFNLEVPPGVPAWDAGYYHWPKYYATPLVGAVNPCSNGVLPCIVDKLASQPGGYPTVDTTDDALTMVNTLPEPWFLYVAYHAIHEPLHRVPGGLPSNTCGAYQSIPSPCSAAGSNFDAARARCMLEALDDQLGRLLCAVDEGDTTVILIGDNGAAKKTFLAPYPQLHGKGTVYQGGLEVPLIVRSPVLAPSLAGTTSDAMVHAVDLFATVAALTGAPAAGGPGNDSVSLLPCLTSPNATVRARNYGEWFAPNFNLDPITGLPPPGYRGNRHDQALTDGRFKLVRLWRRSHAGVPFATEKLFDLVFGGPIDPLTQIATPDYMEANDLLASGAPLRPMAANALARLRHELDTKYLTVVR